MIIKVRVHGVKGGGITVNKKDQRRISRLFQKKVKFTIEYIYDKFLQK